MPWWDDTIKTRGEAWKAELQQLDALIELLPKLHAVVLVGKKAGRAAPISEAHGFPVWHSAHPSGRVRTAYPDQYNAIPDVWAAVALSITQTSAK